MQFRWVAAITVWTFLTGPLFGPPHAPILQCDTQLSPLRQVAEQPPRRPPNTSAKLPSPSQGNRGVAKEGTSSPPARVRAW
jgi:hypothetical protein